MSINAPETGTLRERIRTALAHCTTDYVDTVMKVVEPELAKLQDDPEADDTPFAHPAFLRGSDNGARGCAMRSEEALTEPMPKAGWMREPYENLYHRTEALRKELADMTNALARLVAAKLEKDEHGETPLYAELKKGAWERAIKTIKERRKTR